MSDMDSFPENLRKRCVESSFLLEGGLENYWQQNQDTKKTEIIEIIIHTSGSNQMKRQKTKKIIPA